MHPTDEEFTEIIDAIAADAPPRPVRHRVIWFNIGTGIALIDAILVWILTWFLQLRH